MKYSLCLLVIFFAFSFFDYAAAYEAIPVSPRVPYEAIAVDARINTARSYYGELVGDPHLYEFVVGDGTTLTLSVRQRAEEALPFSVIIVKVRDNDRGVREIGRVSGQASTSWQTIFDSRLGISLANGEVFTADLDPGVYRVEVSTPENVGKYVLTIGDKDSEVGYFASLASIYHVQRFFEYSFFRMTWSSYVYYPFTGLAIASILLVSWYYRRRRHNYA